MTGARAESMRATLAMVDEKWGGVEGYVKEICGADDAMIEGLRRNLRVSVKELGLRPQRINQPGHKRCHFGQITYG